MTMSYADAMAAVTAPGERFETTAADIRGTTVTVFRNAPPSLREIVATTRARGDDVFLVYEDERWTFTQFADQVDGLAAALADRYGIVKGDRVAIGMRNYPEWVVAFAAITSIGAISVSLNAWWTEDELDYALEDCGARVLIADRERLERSEATRKRLGIDAIAVRVDGSHATDRWEDVVVPGASMPDVHIDPTTMRRSCTRPARRAARRERCRPTEAWCRRCSDSVVVPPSNGCAIQSRRLPTIRSRSSSSCRCSTSPDASP